MVALPPVSLGTGPAAEVALGKAFGNILVNLKTEKAKVPAPSTVQEIMDILGESLGDFLLAANQFAQISLDFQSSPIQSAKAIMCPLLDGLSAYTGK